MGLLRGKCLPGVEIWSSIQAKINTLQKRLPFRMTVNECQQYGGTLTVVLNTPDGYMYHED